MMVKTHYTNNEVRFMLEEFRKEHFSPSYKSLADEIGITYTYLVNFKNGDKDMGTEGLQRIVNFIESHEK